MIIFLIALVVASVYPAAAITTNTVTVRSGSIRIVVADNGTYTLAFDTVAGAPPAKGRHLSVHVGGADRSTANGLLRCAGVAPTEGSDKFGAFAGAEISCNTSGPVVPVNFAIRAYEVASDVVGRVVFSLSLPHGANGTAVEDKNYDGLAPRQFAPFPAFETSGVLSTAGFLCYGGDKGHIYSTGADRGGVAGSTEGSCFGLGNVS